MIPEIRGKTMYSVAAAWNPKQKNLAALLSSADRFAEAVELCLEMHALLHDLGDEAAREGPYRGLIDGLDQPAARYRPKGSFSSIAWNLWHITRIEDAVANVLIAEGPQIMNEAWRARLNVEKTDTGNAFGEQDVDALGVTIKVKELLAYRKAVGNRTRKILASLSADDRKRKPSRNALARILDEGVLTDDKDSIWLLDFWGKKTVSGLLTMPITRHQLVHINDSLKLKAKFGKISRPI